MSTWALPVLFAAFIWWFSTGLVLVLDGLPRHTFRWSLVVSSVLALGALIGLQHTADQSTVAGAYCAFTCALLLWGWHELSFLTGWITGPRRQRCSARCRGWRHALHAVEAILWHELGLLASLAAVAWITHAGANPVGLQTFAVLWLMRASAKLNLFLGVRNLGLEFLPAHLAYLQVYFKRRPMNGLFPLSVTASTAATAWMVHAAWVQPEGSAAHIGGLLVASMLALGVLEHWLLVIPVRPGSLWRWALQGRDPSGPGNRPRQGPHTRSGPPTGSSNGRPPGTPSHLQSAPPPTGAPDEPIAHAL